MHLDQQRQSANSECAPEMALTSAGGFFAGGPAFNQSFGAEERRRQHAFDMGGDSRPESARSEVFVAEHVKGLHSFVDNSLITTARACEATDVLIIDVLEVRNAAESRPLGRADRYCH